MRQNCLLLNPLLWVQLEREGAGSPKIQSFELDLIIFTYLPRGQVLELIGKRP